MKPYRSMLFVPANDVRRVGKALTSNADCVILDLEDAVAVSEKQTARNAVCQVLKERGLRDIYVRVNSFDSTFLYHDLTTIVPLCPTGIMLPKAEFVEQIRISDWLISQLELTAGLSPGKIGLIALIETASGVINAPEIAGAAKRLQCLAFGAVDYVLDIGTNLSENGQELFYARSQVVAASRRGGCDKPIDTVYPNFRDEIGLERESKYARGLGFQGKMIIHPGQIDPVHRIFSPTPEEIAFAQRIVDAFEKAEKQGRASIDLEGKMIDYPVMKRARQLLQR